MKYHLSAIANLGLVCICVLGATSMHARQMYVYTRFFTLPKNEDVCSFDEYAYSSCEHMCPYIYMYIHMLVSEY